MSPCTECWECDCICPPKAKPYHKLKLFEKHPLPWKYEPCIAYGENGGKIAGIMDAKDECVATSYWTYDILDTVWDMYKILTIE